MLMFTPDANANGTPYATFTFQVQDNGGTANGGVDSRPVAPTRSRSTSPRSTTRRPARTTPSPPTRTAAYTLAAADFGFSDRQRQPGQRLAAVKITTLPTNGTLQAQRRRGHGRPVRLGRRHQRRQADVHAGRQRQRHAVRELHLPGAGQRRHRQRRRRSRPVAPTRSPINVTSVNDAPAGTDNTVTTNEDTGLHVRRPAISASAIRTTARPTRWPRSRSRRWRRTGR